MKASKYNYTVSDGDGSILMYNGLTGAICALDDENYGLYVKLAAADNRVEPNDPETKVFLRNMLMGGYIKYDEADELGYIGNIINANRCNKNISLTIAPTMDCNFRCTYCFEGENRPEYMSAETEQNILKCVEQLLPEAPEKNRKVSVTWFGGEPTMALDIVYRLSDDIMKIAEKYQAQYSSAIVTNGYMFDRKVAKELSRRNVISVQFTIDGYPELHDKRRPLKNGEGTFHTIIENVKTAAEYIETVCIRVNVDSSNIHETPKLLDVFDEAGLPKSILISLGRIESNTEACKSVSESVLNVPELAGEEVKLFKMMMERNFIVESIPSPCENFCGAIGKNSLLIHPNGDIYKCWNTLGNKIECLGNINDESYSLSKDNKWTLYDPIEREQCKNCKVLPICMSGCPYNRLGEFNKGTDAHCSIWKYNLPDLIRLKYLEYKSKKQLNQK